LPQPSSQKDDQISQNSDCVSDDYDHIYPREEVPNRTLTEKPVCNDVGNNSTPRIVAVPNGVHYAEVTHDNHRCLHVETGSDCGGVDDPDYDLVADSDSENGDKDDKAYQKDHFTLNYSPRDAERKRKMAAPAVTYAMVSKLKVGTGLILILES
jgi:hypothetical protein